MRLDATHPTDAMFQSDDEPASPLLGWASAAFAGLSIALSVTGHAIAHPAGGFCPAEDIWRGTLFAVASVGTAVPGVLAGAAGCVSRRCNRTLGLLGIALNAAFALVFCLLWL